MTIDEAKEVFLNRGFVNGIYDGDKWRESVAVISKLLEQEPCEDAISRQATLAHGTCKDCEHFWCIEDCSSMKVCSKHSAMRISKSFYCKDFEPHEKRGINV